MTYHDDAIQTAGHVWQADMDQELADRLLAAGETATEDLLQMLGIDPAARPSDGHRDEPYGRTIARAVLDAADAVRAKECVTYRREEPAWAEDIRHCRTAINNQIGELDALRRRLEGIEFGANP